MQLHCIKGRAPRPCLLAVPLLLSASYAKGTNYANNPSLRWLASDCNRKGRAICVVSNILYRVVLLISLGPLNFVNKVY
jgi:hypothetical protein